MVIEVGITVCATILIRFSPTNPDQFARSGLSVSATVIRNNFLKCKRHKNKRENKSKEALLFKGTGTLIDLLYKNNALKLGHLSFALSFPILNSSKFPLSGPI